MTDALRDTLRQLRADLEAELGVLVSVRWERVIDDLRQGNSPAWEQIDLSVQVDEPPYPCAHLRMDRSMLVSGPGIARCVVDVLQRPRTLSPLTAPESPDRDTPDP